MPHQTPSPPADHRPVLADLIGGVRRALHRDPDLALAYLDRIASLFAVADEDGGPAQPLLPASRGTPADAVARGGLAPWQIARILRHIEDRLEETVLVETLAALARLSPGHFCRAFKASMDETPHAFLIRQRVRRAQRMMLDSDDTLSRIACACGLTDQAHLTRLFRRLVGETPLIWRRRWRQVA